MAERFRTTSQAERRRGALVRAAAHVAVTQGVDAVNHARVAELAECTRTLVYRYFPGREDLLYGIITTFRAYFDAQLDAGDIARAVVDSAQPGALPDTTRSMLE